MCSGGDPQHTGHVTGRVILTRECCRGSGHFDPQVVFGWPAGRVFRPTHPADLSGNGSPLVSYSSIKTLLTSNKNVHIHPHPFIADRPHTTVRYEISDCIKILRVDPRVISVRAKPAGWEENFRGPRIDSTRDITRVSWVMRVGSDLAERLSNSMGRVGLGQEAFESHGSGRVGSGRSKRLSKYHVRARSGQVKTYRHIYGSGGIR